MGTRHVNLDPHDRSLVQRESQLRGLGTLLDPDAFQAYLTVQCPDWNTPTWKPVYLRYKPHTNCIVTYASDINGRTEYLYAKAFGPDAQAKLNKRSQQTDAAFRVAVDRSLGIAIHRFPSDPELPGLNRLAGIATMGRGAANDPGRPAGLLEPSCERSRNIDCAGLNSQRLWRGMVGIDFDLTAPLEKQIIRYKPERRCVVRLTDRSGRSVAWRFYAPDQFQYAKRAAKIYSALKDLHAAQRLGQSDRQRVFAVEWIPGRPLADCCPQRTAIAWQTAGETLGRLHTHTAKPVRIMSPQSLQQALQEAAQAVCWVCPEIQNPLAALMKPLQAWLDDWSRSMVPIHGDFDGQQVLWDGREARLIDLDNAAFGPPALDLANFLARYAFDNLTSQPASWLDQLHDDPGIRALLEGYAVAAQAIDLERLRPHLAYALLRMAPLPFRLRDPKWPQRTAELLMAARHLYGLAQTGRPSHSAPRHATRDRIACAVSGAEELAADPALRFVLPAMDPEVATTHIAQAVREARRGFLIEKIVSIRLVRRKPGRRCLVEYHCETRDRTGEQSSVVLLGKVHARRLDKRAHDLQSGLRDNHGFRPGQQSCFVPETAGKIPAWHMWLQRQVTGTPLDSVLLPNEDSLPLESVAEAIFKLHQSNLTMDRRHTRHHELEILSDRFQQLSERQPAWSRRLDPLLAQLRAAAESVPVTDDRVIHRDFYPAQVLLARDGVCLLDFDLASCGEAAVDVGNFCGHLRERGLRSCGDAQAFQSLERKFVDRYLQLAGHELRPVIELYALLTMARHIDLSTVLPHRSHVTELLYAWCQQSLRQYPISVLSK